MQAIFINFTSYIFLGFKFSVYSKANNCTKCNAEKPPRKACYASATPYFFKKNTDKNPWLKPDASKLDRLRYATDYKPLN